MICQLLNLGTLLQSVTENPSSTYVPSDCDGCGTTLSLSHALSCRKGGLVIQRYNEIRDAFGDLAAPVWNQVRRVPVVREPDSSCSSPALVADLAVRGVWSPQVDVLLDIHVTDTDASSYVDQAPLAILRRAEAEKKDKYLKACEERRALFTPLCVTVDGMLGPALWHLVSFKHLSER